MLGNRPSVGVTEFLMQQFTSSQVCLMSEFRGIINSDRNPRDKPIPTLFDPSGPRRFSVSGVPDILEARGFTNVRPSIVRAIAVNMINFVARFFAGLIFPNQSVQKSSNAVQFHTEIEYIAPAFNTITDRFSGATRVGRVLHSFINEVMNGSGSPSKDANRWIVIEALAQILLIWHRVCLRHLSLLNRLMLRGWWRSLPSVITSFLPHEASNDKLFMCAMSASGDA